MNIQNMLTEWGKVQRQLPAANNELKAKVLASYSLTSKPDSKKFNFKYPVFAVSSLVLVLFIMLVYRSNIVEPTPLSYINSSANKSVAQSNSLGVNSNLTNQSDTSNSRKNEQELDARQTSGKSQGVFEAVPRAAGLAQNMPIDDVRVNHDIQPVPLTPPQQPIAITDSREFLKVNYSADIQSRDVSQSSQKIQGTIESLDGRIDSLSENNDDSYINFVIPKSHLEAFKVEIKNMVGDKFYLESSQTTNYLPEKQGIEQNSKSTQQTLDALSLQRDNLTSQHNRTLSGLKFKINSFNQQIKNLQDQQALSPLNIDLQNKIQNLKNQLSVANRDLENENYSYQDQLSELTSEISNSQASLTNLSHQDQNLQDDVATVNGNIRIIHISWFEYINAYLPFYFSLPGLVLILFAVYYSRRCKIILP